MSTAAAAFSELYGYAPDGVWSAPGRVNIIGEHTDYNDGFVFPMAIDRRARVAAAQRQDGVLRLATTAPGEPAEIAAADLAPGVLSGWSRYLAGVHWAFGQRGVRVPGMDILLESDVPVGAGLSSSAAIECAAALAFAEAAGADLPREELVLICQQAENDFAGAPTGILDQSASLLSREGHGLFLDCRSRQSRLVSLDLGSEGMTVLVIDTKVSHAHDSGGYAERRRDCERAAEELGVGALRDVDLSDLVLSAQGMDQRAYRRARHVVSENSRVLTAVGQLEAGRPIRSLGPVLASSHESLRDDFEVSCPELDLAVEAAMAAGAAGARMTGGGFGGSALALVTEAGADSVERAVTRVFARAGYTVPEVFAVNPGAGARRES
ncbi:galactokinase [Arthrobacter sp. BL-252-APC-1A]|uniref:galactokinase n=1 Tax=Arthrobacter sp. BL-252-APC-1A TaxID=2606622 RepID=UPI00131360A9|nr:galactokinase [Arthrobacter sp. BL-252-APC-1A]MSR97493.1 galactokinase [Arthrobacter sp. BL-252-APC-1A]